MCIVGEQRRRQDAARRTTRARFASLATPSRHGVSLTRSLGVWRHVTSLPPHIDMQMPLLHCLWICVHRHGMRGCRLLLHVLRWLHAAKHVREAPPHSRVNPPPRRLWAAVVVRLVCRFRRTRLLPPLGGALHPCTHPAPAQSGGTVGLRWRTKTELVVISTCLGIRAQLPVWADGQR